MDAVVSRRDAIRAGVGAAGGFALAVVASNVACAADAKLAKATVQYVDDGKLPGKDCDDCIHVGSRTRCAHRARAKQFRPPLGDVFAAMVNCHRCTAVRS
jgi:hypothetical protein